MMDTVSKLLVVVATALSLLCLGASRGAAQAEALPQEVHFASLDGTPLKALLFQPKTAARGTVVALHGCDGLYATQGKRKGLLNARHQAMAEMLLGEGYAVLMPDSFTPRGVPQLCLMKQGERPITERERRRDALAALNWAAAQPWTPPGHVALLGWSHGGSAVLATTNSRQPEVAAQKVRPAIAIAFYPGCRPWLKNYQPDTQLAMMLGELDDWTDPAPCIALGRAVGAEVNVYPNSYHAFDNPVGQVHLLARIPNGVHPGQGVHAGRNAAAREQAYARVRDLLAQTWPRP